MKLTDQQILSIFGKVITGRDGPSFIKTYADCVVQANHRDFLILRPVSLILIGEYNLGHLLEGSDPEIKVHNFPGRTG
jgi:hypothetical protein